MDRRSFIKNTLGVAALFGSIDKIGGYSELFGKSLPANPALPYDLVAIKGGEPDEMFDQAIKEMGGLKNFIKKGQKVVIKPNIGWDVIPERAANTNPKLIGHLTKKCFEAGAKEVYVFDNTCDEWTKAYKNSGIEKAVKDAGGTLAPANSKGYYQDVTISNTKKLTSAKVHELILSSDVFINVPVLKSHSSARLTMAMKNLMGIVWDRGYWHANDLHQCIADFATYSKPTLNILDGYLVMKRNGPRGVSKDDVVQMNTLLISKDIVAIDAAGAKLFGYEPKDVRYIQIANDYKTGTLELDKLNIKRITL